MGVEQEKIDFHSRGAGGIKICIYFFPGTALGPGLVLCLGAGLGSWVWGGPVVSELNLLLNRLLNLFPSSAYRIWAASAPVRGLPLIPSSPGITFLFAQKHCMSWAPCFA